MFRRRYSSSQALLFLLVYISVFLGVGGTDWFGKWTAAFADNMALWRVLAGQ